MMKSPRGDRARRAWERRSRHLLAWLCLTLIPCAPVIGTDIHRAVHDDDIVMLDVLLETAGRNAIDATLPGGITALHLATAADNEAAVALLICAGADLNARTIAGFTPLHWAANRDSVKAADLLISMGADPTAQTANGITPLHWAANKNATNVVKLLLANGVDPLARTGIGLTPLHWAMMKESTDAGIMLSFRIVSEEMENETAARQDALDREDQATEPMNEEPEPEPTPATTAQRPPPRTAFGKTLLVDIGFGQTLSFVWIKSLKLWVGKHEITNAQYRRFRPQHRSRTREGISLDGSDQPVVYVSWNDANDFSRWLNRTRADRIPLYCSFRLPLEEEWILTARCGDTRVYPWGNRWPPAYGNYSDITARRAFPDWSGIRRYDDGFAVTCPVEQSGSNEWGIFGLAGNVWEWCLDWSDDSRDYKIRHGASWDYDGKDEIPIHSRGIDRPTARYSTIGFRVVVALDERLGPPRD